MIDRVNVFPIQTPTGLLSFYGNSNVNYEIILGKENKVGGLTLFDFKTYYKVNIRVWYLNKYRQIHQWNRIKGPEIGSNSYG